jgi:hypothetical protein
MTPSSAKASRLPSIPGGRQSAGSSPASKTLAFEGFERERAGSPDKGREHLAGAVALPPSASERDAVRATI